jgi:hypothetical protein
VVGIAVSISNGKPLGQVLPGQRTEKSLQVIEHELLLSIDGTISKPVTS